MLVTGIGVYNASSGTIIIGEKDGNVDVTTPEITGGYVGLHNIYYGYLYFYDGKIKGETLAISGDVTEVETNYEIKYSENNTIATLQL